MHILEGAVFKIFFRVVGLGNATEVIWLSRKM